MKYKTCFYLIILFSISGCIDYLEGKKDYSIQLLETNANTLVFGFKDIPPSVITVPASAPATPTAIPVTMTLTNIVGICQVIAYNTSGVTAPITSGVQTDAYVNSFGTIAFVQCPIGDSADYDVEATFDGETYRFDGSFTGT